MLVVTGRSQNYVVFHKSKCPSQEKTQSKNVPVKKSPSQKMSMESRKGLSRNVDQEMSVKKRPIKKCLDTDSKALLVFSSLEYTRKVVKWVWLYLHGSSGFESR